MSGARIQLQLCQVRSNELLIEARRKRRKLKKWVHTFISSQCTALADGCFAARRSALVRHLLWRRGCLCICQVYLVCSND